MGITDRIERTYECDYPGCDAKHTTANDFGDQGFRTMRVDAGDATQIYFAVLCARHDSEAHAALRRLGFYARQR